MLKNKALTYQTVSSYFSRNVVQKADESKIHDDYILNKKTICLKVLI